jgi:hypothetical protein
MDYTYRLQGHVNSRLVDGRGTGRIDPDAGISELDVTFPQRPTGWDPRSIVLMCCSKSAVLGTRATDGAIGLYRASGGYLTIGRELVQGFRWGMIRDEAGQIMADIRASSVTDFRPEHATDASRIEGGVSHLEPGINGVAAVQTLTGLMVQAGPNLVTVTTNYTVTLEDGSTAYGTTFYPFYLPEQRVTLPGPQLLTVQRLDQELTGNRMRMNTESTLTPLVPAAVSDPALISTLT